MCIYIIYIIKITVAIQKIKLLPFYSILSFCKYTVLSKGFEATILNGNYSVFSQLF